MAPQKEVSDLRATAVADAALLPGSVGNPADGYPLSGVLGLELEGVEVEVDGVAPPTPSME
jgi:hypothetical protein